MKSLNEKLNILKKELEKRKSSYYDYRSWQCRKLSVGLPYVFQR